MNMLSIAKWATFGTSVGILVAFIIFEVFMALAFWVLVWFVLFYVIYACAQ